MARSQFFLSLIFPCLFSLCCYLVTFWSFIHCLRIMIKEQPVATDMENIRSHCSLLIRIWESSSPHLQQEILGIKGNFHRCPLSLSLHIQTTFLIHMCSILTPLQEQACLWAPASFTGSVMPWQTANLLKKDIRKLTYTWSQTVVATNVEAEHITANNLPILPLLRRK